MKSKLNNKEISVLLDIINYYMGMTRDEWIIEKDIAITICDIEDKLTQQYRQNKVRRK